MKISYKIILGFALTVTLAATVFISGAIHLNMMSAQHDQQTSINVPTIEALHEILIAGLRIVASSAEIIMLKEHAKEGLELKKNIIKEEISELGSGYREIYDYHEKYYDLMHKYFPDKAEELEEVTSVVERLVSSSTKLIDFENMGDRPGLMALEEELEEADDVFVKSLNRIILAEEKVLDREKDALIVSGEKTKLVLLALTLLALAGAAFSIFWILKPFKNGLASLARASEQIAHGDFDLKLDECRTDEFGILAGEFCKMAGDLSSSRTLADWSLLKIEKYAADLKAKSREYEEFVFIASHDLQEPLRKIMTYASRVRKGIAGHVSEESEEFITKVIESSTYLREKLDSLSDYSKINMEGKGFTRVRLNEILDKVVKRLQDIRGTKKATFIIDNLPEIDGKAEQLEKMFHCLIDNSYKFCGAEPLEIKVTSIVIENENYCRILLEDNGIGFDQKFAGKIFRVFHSLDTQKYAGLGMGLAIVKKIVDVHGGSITVESSPGSGAGFTIVFPISQTGRHEHFNLKPVK